jgi:hypothetical protein
LEVAVIRLIAALSLLAAPLAAQAERAHGPLTEAQHALFWGSAEDAPPEKLDATRKDLEGRHYLSGDERHMHLFYPTVKDLGGAYMGVGSDQAYMFAGWMKAEYVWLSDYDPWIKWLHMSYAAFFEVSPDIATFRSWWTRENNRKALKLLAKRYKGHPLAYQIRFVYPHAAHKVNRRLRRLNDWAKTHGVPNFVSDEAQYKFVRALVMEKRVRPLVCNLLDTKCLIGIGDTMRKLKTPVRVLYPSNAEQYWPYGDQYRANVRGLHFDEKSWVTRTLGIRHQNDDYHYSLQPALKFQKWLAQPELKSVKQVYPKVKVSGHGDIPFTTVDADAYGAGQ